MNTELSDAGISLIKFKDKMKLFFTQKPVTRKHIGTIQICFKDKPDTEGLRDKTQQIYTILCVKL